MHQSGRALDVGHHHRHEAGRQRGGTVGPRVERTLGLQLSGDESDRNDLELLRRVQHAHPSALAGPIVLEVDLAEASQGVAHVRRVVDRQTTATAGVDVREGSVGQPGAFARIQASHARDDTSDTASPAVVRSCRVSRV
jgi:hypothetical protein